MIRERQIGRRERTVLPTRTSTCTALRVVDQMPFLKAAVRTCKRLRTELRTKQKALQDFEEKDNAAFRQWLNATFGRELSEVRDLEDEIREYYFILETLDWCRSRCPGALKATHTELFERKAQGTLAAFVMPEPDEPDEAFGDDDEEDGESDDKDDPFDEFEDDFHDGVEDDEGDLDDENGGFDNGGPRAGKRGRGSRNLKNDPRLKALYRTMAKRLHPDHSRLKGALREQRWHELQAAYQQGDLKAMLRVEAVCDMDESGLTVELGLARLNDLASYHKAHLAPLRRALKEMKQHPAFEFTKRDPRNLKYMVGSDLELSVAELKSSIHYLHLSSEEFLQYEAAPRPDDFIHDYSDDFDEYGDGYDDGDPDANECGEPYGDYFTRDVEPESSAESKPARHSVKKEVATETKEPEQLSFF